MKGRLTHSLVCLAVLAAASSSFAQYSNPCEADIARFCSNIQPGRGAIFDCLNQNEAQLSKECKSMHLSQLSEILRQTQEVCKADGTRLCGGEIQQPGERLLVCLKMNASSLSPECKKKFFEALELLRY